MTPAKDLKVRLTDQLLSRIEKFTLIGTTVVPP